MVNFFNRPSLSYSFPFYCLSPLIFYCVLSFMSLPLSLSFWSLSLPRLLFSVSVIPLKGSQEFRRSPLHGNTISLHSYIHTHHTHTHRFSRLSSHNTTLPQAVSLYPAPFPPYALSLPLFLPLSRSHTLTLSCSPSWSTANAAPSADCEMFTPACKGSAGESR